MKLCLYLCCKEGNIINPFQKFHFGASISYGPDTTILVKIEKTLVLTNNNLAFYAFFW